MTSKEIHEAYERDIANWAGDMDDEWWEVVYRQVRAMRAATSEADAFKLLRQYKWGNGDRIEDLTTVRIVRGWYGKNDDAEKQLEIGGVL
jgi:hypothetical protein